MNIFVAIPNEYGGCGFYRQYQPHNRLAKTHSDVNVLFGAGLKKDDDEWMDLSDTDIFQLHKNYYDFEAIEKCKSLGIVTIIDFDDWWNLDTEHIFYKLYADQGTSKILIRLLKSVDYVTCTTELLADEIRKHNDNVIVLPNAMDMNYEGCKVNRVKEDKTVFAYLGGHCHMKDVEMLRGLNNKLSVYNNYKLRLMGVDGTKIYNKYALIMSDNGRLAGDKFDWMEKANIWSYMKFYNYLDVSLVPLADNKFNSLKSELKLIEAGFFKKAVIVSNVEPYAGLLKHKQNAMVVNKPSDWFKNAKYLLQNPEAIVDLGEALYETVQKFDIDVVNEKRYKFYNDVLKNKHTNSSVRDSRLQGIDR